MEDKEGVPGWTEWWVQYLLELSWWCGSGTTGPPIQLIVGDSCITGPLALVTARRRPASCLICFLHQRAWLLATGPGRVQPRHAGGWVDAHSFPSCSPPCALFGGELRPAPSRERGKIQIGAVLQVPKPVSRMQDRVDGFLALCALGTSRLGAGIEGDAECGSGWLVAVCRGNATRRPRYSERRARAAYFYVLYIPYIHKY